ncbi:MAG: hypothetical protein KDA98_12900, partial [Acidimicrobiales bacterium]|nr:hypothetical protein [Acidimicrobiales bacterium]
DESMPNATFMNFARNEDITNTGALPLSSSGPDDLKVRNFGSASHYVIDLQGYFIDIGDVPNDGSGALYVPITPCRIVDTRIAGGAIADRQIRPYDVRGVSGFTDQGGNSGGCGVPFGASATETSVTAVDPVGSGFFRAWPGDEPMPNATFMNFSRLQDITNTGSIPLAHGGPDDLKVRNFGSASQYVLDLQGYWQPLPIIT